MYGHVVLAGNLGADPEKRKTKGDEKFVTFSLAVQLEGHDGDATWFDIAVFNERPRDFIAKYAKKGSSVILSGRLRPNKFDRKDGTKVEGFAVTAEDVSFLSTGKKKDGDEGGSDEGTFGGDGGSSSSGGDGEDW